MLFGYSTETSQDQHLNLILTLSLILCKSCDDPLTVLWLSLEQANCYVAQGIAVKINVWEEQREHQMRDLRGVFLPPCLSVPPGDVPCAAY